MTNEMQVDLAHLAALDEDNMSDEFYDSDDEWVALNGPSYYTNWPCDIGTSQSSRFVSYLVKDGIK